MDEKEEEERRRMREKGEEEKEEEEDEDDREEAPVPHTCPLRRTTPSTQPNKLPLASELSLLHGISIESMLTGIGWKAAANKAMQTGPTWNAE